MAITWRSMLPIGLNPQATMNGAVNTLNNAFSGLQGFGAEMKDLNTNRLNEGAKLATEDLIARMRAQNLNLGSLNKAEGQYTDADTIRGMLPANLSDRANPNDVMAAFSELQNKYRDDVYNQAAAAGKAHADKTGSVAEGAALAEQIMRQAGMKENILSQRSGNLMNNDMAVMKAQLGEDVTANTNAYIGGIDLSKLNANSMPGVLKQAQDLHGKKIDLDKVRGFVNDQLKLQSDEEMRNLTKQSMRQQMELARKASEMKDNPLLIDTDAKTGVTSITFKDGSGTYETLTEEAMRARATEEIERKDLAENKSGWSSIYKRNFTEAQKKTLIDDRVKDMKTQQEQMLLQLRGRVFGIGGTPENPFLPGLNTNPTGNGVAAAVVGGGSPATVPDTVSAHSVPAPVAPQPVIQSTPVQAPVNSAPLAQAYANAYSGGALNMPGGTYGLGDAFQLFTERQRYENGLITKKEYEARIKKIKGTGK